MEGRSIESGYWGKGPYDMSLHYYAVQGNRSGILVSPIQNWGPRDDTRANNLSLQDLNLIVAAWKGTKNFVRLESDDWLCTLETVGVGKHAQATIPASIRSRLSVNIKQAQWKELVHLIWWRWENGGALIPADLHISHRHHDGRVLKLVAEDRLLNESRKACHSFGWYNGGCPHVYAPCL